jgi:hypothetical protein
MSEPSALIQPDFDPADYPRTYRAAGGSAVFMSVMGAIGTVGGVLGVWYLGFRVEPANVIQRLTGGIIFSGVCLGGIYLLLLVARFKILLEADRIEHQTVTFRRTLPRSDIRGWRFVQGKNNPPMISIVPRAGAGKTLQLMQMFRLDAPFESWLDTLPNLDALELEASNQEVAGNEGAGLTPEQRFASLAQAKKLATALSVAGWVSLAWTFAYPYPPQMLAVILAAQPWAALFLVSRLHGLIRVGERKNDVRPNVAFGLILPGLALAFLSLRGPHILHWRSVMWLSVAVGFALVGFARTVDRSQKAKWSAFGLFVVSLFYGWGSVVELNTVFDKSQTTIYPVPIVSKHITHGKSTSYNLKLAAWEFETAGTQVSVSRDLYESVQPGDPVCVVLRAGALRIPWYRVTSCR